MERHNSEDDEEETSTDQIKLKAQEIAKRLEKYQGRYHTTSRCNTPLPITKADSIESIHSVSAISDASEKLLLFRQFLENDRKLVENVKIDEQKYNSDGQADDDDLLDVQFQVNKYRSTYCEDIIEATCKEQNVQSLKNEILELHKKLENCMNVINEKDVLLQSKIDKIELLNKTIKQKNKLHLETVDALKKSNIEIINNERLRFSQKINRVVEETEELKQHLDYVNKKYDELKKKNIIIDKENEELRKNESYLMSEIENLSVTYENEKKLLLQQNNESSKKIINDIKKELLILQNENDALKKHVIWLEKSISTQENDDLLTKLSMKEDEIQHLNHEIEKLNRLYQNQTVEVKKTEDRWTKLKDAYLNDKNRMTFLEKVVEELKINNDELNSTNVKLIEDKQNFAEELIALKTENSRHQERISHLMAVIENMQEQFEKALQDNTIEYEQDKKMLIQLHEQEKSSLKNCNTKLEENTLKLNKVTDQLNVVLKENDSYKTKNLEWDRVNTRVSELNNTINDLNNDISQKSNELDFLKIENSSLSDKLNRTSLEIEENKLLSNRFLKQKQLLKLKIKALKESEKNCLMLQQNVTSLTEKIQNLSVEPKCLDHNDEKVSAILHYCDKELQSCDKLLNTILTKCHVQTQNINTLRCVLMELASLFPFDSFDDVYLVKIIDSISDDELQFCLKKIIMGSIQVFEDIIHLKNDHKLSEAQLIARIEVDKIISKAVEKVPSENEYYIQNNELLSLIENLQHDNHKLRLNITSNNKIFESKEILTDLHGSTMQSLLLDDLDVKNIKNENYVLKQFFKNIQEKLGMFDFKETNNVVLLSSLSELELLVQEMKNENLLLKNQCLEHQKILTLKTLEHTEEQQIDKTDFSLNAQKAYIQSMEMVKDNHGDEKKTITSENVCIKHSSIEKSNPTVSSDSKILLVRYKNLKSKFKEVRDKTSVLENKIVILTNDLECANLKYKQLYDQYVSSNETYETDVANCQSEIENLMSEKLEAYRQLTALKEKHEILQNDYDQLKSNLNDQISSNDIDSSTHIAEQNTILKKQLNDTQRLIDTAYSKVLCEWPPADLNLDWVVAQSRKLDDIINAKCISTNRGDNGFEESEVERLKSCVQIIHELVTSILTNKYNIEVSFTEEVVNLMLKLKSYTETFLEFVSVKKSDSHLVDENHIKISHCDEGIDENALLSKQNLHTEEPFMKEPSIPLVNEPLNPSILENKENENLQQAIAERDRLIAFLSDKISKLDNISRNNDDLILVRYKLDRALTAVHERDVRCDELTLELTRLLEERDMLQLKLSDSIRQIQFLSDNKQQINSSNLLEEMFGSKNIDDKLEELHSLEYRRDADLFNDQEQRHKSQMLLHQTQNSSKMLGSKSSDTNEEASSTQSWFKDILW